MRNLLPLAILIVAGYYILPVNAFLPDDRTFFVQPDANDWPGDALSERQWQAAVMHFASRRPCSGLWRWAMIGPDTWLLKGTQYTVVRAAGAEVPNVHYSHGYWGGTTLLTMSVALGKKAAEEQASDDCRYGDRP